MVPRDDGSRCRLVPLLALVSTITRKAPACTHVLTTFLPIIVSGMAGSLRKILYTWSRSCTQRTKRKITFSISRLGSLTKNETTEGVASVGNWSGARMSLDPCVIQFRHLSPKNKIAWGFYAFETHDPYDFPNRTPTKICYECHLVELDDTWVQARNN